MMASKKHVQHVKNNFRHRLENNFSILNSHLDAIDRKFLESAALQRKDYFKQLRTDTLTQKEIKGTMEEIREWRNGTLLFQVENYMQMLAEAAIVFSDEFYSSQHGCMMKVKLNFTMGGRIFCSLHFQQGEYDDLLPSGFYFCITYSVMDQSVRNGKRDMILINEPRFGVGVNELMEDSGGVWIVVTNNYIKNNSFQLKVMVEPLSLLFKNYFSRNGILLWTINNYKMVKQESMQTINRYAYSDYFYSSQKGFRMQAQMEWRNGVVYFALCFMVGENDADLPFCQFHECTLSIISLNVESLDKDIILKSKTLDVAEIADKKRAKQEMIGNNHYLMGIKFPVIEREPYLINNRVIFKITVR